MTFSAKTFGWIGVALFVLAGAVPLAHRLFTGRRVVPEARATRVHWLLGLGAALASLAHAMSILPSLGSPAAIAGGAIAMVPAALAFFLLFAHIGVGSRLLSPRLRDRPKQRRLHLLFAVLIAIALSAHVLALRLNAST